MPSNSFKLLALQLEFLFNGETAPSLFNITLILLIGVTYGRWVESVGVANYQAVGGAETAPQRKRSLWRLFLCLFLVFSCY